MDVDKKWLVLLVVQYLTPEIYKDEVYLWEIASVLGYLASRDPTVASVLGQSEHDAEFMKSFLIEATRQILALPGVETFFTGWPLEGDWKPHRITMPAEAIIESIQEQLDQLGREPVALEIAFFSGVES